MGMRARFPAKTEQFIFIKAKKGAEVEKPKQSPLDP
jgi:hypothetical protein